MRNLLDLVRRSATRPAELVGQEGVDRAAAVLLTVAFILLFMVTGRVSRQYREHEKQLAASFSKRGDAGLRDGRPAEAVAAYRDALFYARHDPGGQFRLAQALLAAGQPHDAQPYLQALWQQDPSVGIVNLELARMQAAEGALAEAVRHYQGAIHGIWDTGAEGLRRTAQLELIAYLQRSGESRQAVAELVALTSALDDDDDAGHAKAGHLFMDLGEPRQALGSFRKALSAQRADPAVLAGAGRAAIELGEWRTARDYLRRVPAASRSEALVRQLEIAEHIVDLDPWVPRTSLSERGRRAREAVAAARSRFDACFPDSDPGALRQGLDAAKRALRPEALRRDPDAIDAAFGAALTAEESAQSGCAAGKAIDEAVLVLGRRRRGLEDDGHLR